MRTKVIFIVPVMTFLLVISGFAKRGPSETALETTQNGVGMVSFEAPTISGFEVPDTGGIGGLEVNAMEGSGMDLEPYSLLQEAPDTESYSLLQEAPDTESYSLLQEAPDTEPYSLLQEADDKEEGITNRNREQKGKGEERRVGGEDHKGKHKGWDENKTGEGTSSPPEDISTDNAIIDIDIDIEQSEGVDLVE